MSTRSRSGSSPELSRYRNSPVALRRRSKTAAKWLNQYQNLDTLIAHAADISGKVGENLRNELPMLELSRKLATIDTTLQLEVTPEQLGAGAPDVPRLRELYSRMDMRALLKSLGPEVEPVVPQGGTEIDLVVAETVTVSGPEVAAAVAVIPSTAFVPDRVS